MALKVTSSNGVKVYNCTAGKSTPQWYEDAAKKTAKGSLRYNEDFRRRIDLIEDFQFPATSNRIKMSPDGEFIAVTGMYGPQIKMYETSQLSLKFERHIDAEAVEFQFLSSDFRKLALLRSDRTVEIHAAYGRHHEVKIPRFGRDILYESGNCDLYVCAAGEEVYRLNLEQGRFLAPLQTSFLGADNATGRKGGVSCGGINPMHHLLAFGGEAKDVVELWDPRDRTCLTTLSLSDTLKGTDPSTAAELEREGAAVSSIRFHDTDGLTLAVGTTTGHVLLYDLRSSTPLLVKDHRYGLPIHDLKFHTQTKNVISSDAKVVKVWSQQSGDIFTNIEPEANINDTCIHPNSGLIMCAGEQQRMQVYYVPSLGPAPKWCSFLDSLTEELEEKTEQSLYDDYKFLTRQELESYGMEYLIGQPQLKAYMHGFFMDLRLYNRIRSMVTQTPDAYENYMKKKIDEKLKLKQQNRIVIKSKLPQVNTAYAQTLLAQPKLKKALKESDVTTGENMLSNPLADSRFGSLFSNKDFDINPESEEFKRLNPHAAHAAAARAGQAKSKGTKRKHDDEYEEQDGEDGRDDRFDLIDRGDDDEEDEEDGNDAHDSGDDSDEDYVHKKGGRSSGMAIAKLAEKISKKASTAADSIGTKKPTAPAMYSLKQGFTAAHILDANGEQDRLAKLAKGMTMAERLKFEEDQARQAKQQERWGSAASRPAKQPRLDGGSRGGFRGGKGGAESGRKGRGMDQLMGRERSGRGGFGEENSGRGGRGGFRGRGRGRGR